MSGWQKYWQRSNTHKWKSAAIGKVPADAMFETALAFQESAAGLIYDGDLYIDIDVKPDENETASETQKRIEKARQEAENIIRNLEAACDFRPQDIRAWFSGSAGFHLAIPSKSFGGVPDPELALIYRDMISRLFGDGKSRGVFPYIDRRVYSTGKGRMWRRENIRRENGAYKVPVTAGEILNQDAAFFIALSKNKRERQGEDEEPKVNEALVEMFWEVKTEHDRKRLEAEMGGRSAEPVKLKAGVMGPCIRKVLGAERVEGRTFNDLALLIATYFFNAELDPKEADRFLERYPSRSYPNAATRQREFLKKYEYVKKNKVAWSCGFARAIGECDKCKAVKKNKVDKDCEETIREAASNRKGFVWDNLPEKMFPDREAEVKRRGLSGSITLDDMIATVKKWYENYDVDIIKLVMATVLAIRLEVEDRVWLLIVAPPSGGKTSLIKALRLIQSTYEISSLTPKTLFSGYTTRTGGNTRSGGLVQELNKKVITFKDFTSVISKDAAIKTEILGQFRELFDGYYHNATGRDSVLWRGKVGLLGGVTGAIEKELTLEANLGERFLLYRRVDGPEENGERDVDDEDFESPIFGHEKIKAEEIEDAAWKLLNGIRVPDPAGFKLEPGLSKRLAAISKLLARARYQASRDTRRPGRPLISDAEREDPYRIYNQLKTLGICLATIRGDDTVRSVDFAILAKVVISTIPSYRWKVLKCLWLNKGKRLSRQEIAEQIEVATSTVIEKVDELIPTKIALVARELKNKLAAEYYGSEDDDDSEYGGSRRRRGGFMKGAWEHWITPLGTKLMDQLGPAIDLY